jgi:hypothetical protein
MTEASLALQKALYGALSADTVLSDRVTGIFDWAPDGQKLPYVQIGEDIVTDWSTKSFTGTEHRLTLHVWSQATGRLQGKQIMADIARVLAQPLTLPALQLVSLRFLSGQALRDADTQLHHAVMEYRARICA